MTLSSGSRARPTIHERALRRRRSVVGATLALLVVGLPASALAQASIDFMLTVGQNQTAADNATSLTPRLSLGIPTSRELRVIVEWGLTTVSVPQSTDNGIDTVNGQETGFLNPHVEVSYGLKVPRRTYDFTFGVATGMAFPVADADDPNRAAAYQVALSSVGAWDPWLYLPNTLGFTLPIEAELDFRNFVLSVDTAFFLLIPTEDTRDRNTQFGSQAGVEGFFPVGLFDLGLRLQAVQVGASGESEAYVQTSMVPLVRLFLGPAVIETQFNFNFGTQSSSTTFGSGGTWGLSVGLGINF